MLLRLALRNLLRSKRRTVLSTFAIVLGVFYLVVGRALVGGISEGIIQATENGLTGHVLIRPKDYPTTGLSHPVDKLVVLPDAAAALLRERAEATTGRVMFTATLTSGADSLRVRGIGFDPATDEAVFRRSTWQLAEGGAVPATATDGVLLGSGLARLLQVEAGDRLVVQARTHKGAINALETRVAGVLGTGNTALDGNALLAPMPLVDSLIRAPQPTHVAARVQWREDAPALAEALRPALGPDLEVTTWKDETAELLRLQEVRKRALNMLVGVLLAMSGFAIANTILMAAHERVREIGALRALGMTARQVFGLFLLEGGLMGVTASVLGAALGAGLASHFAAHPIDLAAASKAMSGNLQFSTWLYAAWHPSLLVTPVVMSASVALLASLYPARIASRLVVAEAVRAE